ncbi:MAG: DUF1488 family protein [Hyphomicrobiales bacterium]
MSELAFTSDERLFDGHLVRFAGTSGDRKVRCAVTLIALKQLDPSLPHEGLLPSDLFVSAYDRHMTDIHHICRQKHARGDYETEGEIDIVVHRADVQRRSA